VAGSKRPGRFDDYPGEAVRLNPLKKKSTYRRKSEKNVKKRVAYQKFDIRRPAK
jgi:hypothetical protein